MDILRIIDRVKNKNISISVHAVKRLHQRNINIDNLLIAMISGQIIEEYEDDYPYPSCLILGFIGERPIHVVCSDSNPLYIITAYEPNLIKWKEDFKTRR